MTPPTTAPAADLDTTDAPTDSTAGADEFPDGLIEEVSIDGLCGVY